MKPANPFRYLIHNKAVSDVINKNETLNHLQLNHDFDIKTLSDCHIMGRDFYAVPVNGGLLISPIPGNMVGDPERDIAKQSPELHQLDRFTVNEHYSLCWEKGKLPDFGDLMRLEGLFLGYVPTFEGFKDQTVIPIARSPKEDSLPKTFCFDSNGNPVEHVEKKWQFLWEIGRTYYDSWVTEEEDEKLPLASKVEMALQILSINYRIGKPEINAFYENGRPVLSTQNVDRILMNLIDVPNMPTKDSKKNTDS